MHRLIIIALLATLGCVAGPFERANAIDQNADLTLELLDVPDTIFTLNTEFAARLRASLKVPSRADTTWFITAGLGAITSLGGGRFEPDVGIGLVPTTVTIGAALRDATGPRVTKDVVVFQKPQSAQLRCDPAGPLCSPVAGAGVTRTLLLSVTDVGGAPVNLPFTSFRFGLVTVRNPSVVEVLDRPTPISIRIRTLAAGSTYVVLSEGAISDSVQIVVTP